MKIIKRGGITFAEADYSYDHDKGWQVALIALVVVIALVIAIAYYLNIQII